MMTRRFLILIYGIASYLIGMASLVYMMGWLGYIFVPKSIDSEPQHPLLLALAINALAFLGFSIQHSVMARPAFKRWWTRIIPKEAERSTYVLFSGVAMFALMFAWSPLGGTVWKIESQPIRCLLHTTYLGGWAILVASTFSLNHFDLFGLRQVWLQFRGREYTDLKFATPGPYRIVRHPLYVGWLTLAWATPNMTVAHLLFALGTTVYILTAIRWEEKDLVEVHGAKYQAYQAETPMLIPRIKSTPKSRMVANS